jgi:hypothetical protein
MIKKIVVAGLVLAAVAFSVQAATVTNRLGQVMTVSKMSEAMAASTLAGDLLQPVNTLVVHYKVTSGDTNAIDISTTDLPKGAILMEDALIEVTTAVTPATSTNSIAVGGITVLATGVTLNATGIKQAVATPGITTSADKVALTITGDAATAGEFTIYLPYVMGTAQ